MRMSFISVILSILGPCTLVGAIGCSRTNAPISVRGTDVAVAPGIRGSSSVAPCPKTSEQSKPSASGLNLNVPELSSKSKDLGSYESGGYISVRFYGLQTDLDKFKAPLEDSGGRVSHGNPLGVIDVLNIPYCHQAKSNVDENRIKRCVSRSVWKEIQNDTVAISKLKSSWKPDLFYKTCTALVSVDRTDLKINSKSSKKHRLRVWTAEHCFQPSYATEVFLNLSDPKKDKESNYVSMKLNAVDGIEYVKRVIDKRGNGDDSDSLLRTKLFILRSLDGRSADTYQSALHEGCLKKGNEILFSDRQTKARNVDCFTSADLSTFKATVDTDSFSEKASIALMPSERTLSVEDLRERREKILRRINKSAAKSDHVFEKLFNATLNSNSFDSDAKNQLNGFSNALPQEIRSVFSFGEMIRSQMDGIQQARRFEAMQYELGPEGAGTGLNRESLGDFFDLFKVLKLSFGGANFIAELSGILNQVLPGTGDLTCNMFSLGGCPQYIMSPPGTADLEELLFARSANLNEYLSRRLQVMLLGLSNSQLPENHPFRITSADTDGQANIKMGAVWTRVIFESATLRKEPFKESPFYNGLSKFFQQTIFAMCPSADFVGGLFPVVGNLISGNERYFGSSSILGGSQSLKILPVVGSSTPTPEFNTVSCGGRHSEVMRHLGEPVMVDGFAMPEEPIVGLDADDSVLRLPPDRAAYEYMTRRVIYKFAGAKGSDLRVAGPMDSGMAWTFLGFGLLVLSSHNGQLTNGAVFVDMPDINTADPDAGAPVNKQGRPIVTCSGQ